jgi:hypothetical protein
MPLLHWSQVQFCSSLLFLHICIWLNSFFSFLFSLHDRHHFTGQTLSLLTSDNVTSRSPDFPFPRSVLIMMISSCYLVTSSSALYNSASLHTLYIMNRVRTTFISDFWSRFPSSLSSA